MNVFSRSTHIQSLGLYYEDRHAEGESDLIVNLEPNLVAKSHQVPITNFEDSSREVEAELLEAESEPIGRSGLAKYDDSYDSDSKKDGHDEIARKSWDEFKADFADVLRSSEAQIASGQLGPTTSSSTGWLGHQQDPAPSADVRQSILIEMITSLHNSRNLPPTGTDTAPSDKEWSPEDPTPTRTSQGSPTRPRKQLLSLTTLETIHEAEIDRLLEKVEDASSDQGVDLEGDSGDVFSLPDSSSGIPMSSTSQCSKLAWGMKESADSRGVNDDLMKQLHQLSLAQRSRHVDQGGLEGVTSHKPVSSDIKTAKLEPGR